MYEGNTFLFHMGLTRHGIVKATAVELKCIKNGLPIASNKFILIENE